MQIGLVASEEKNYIFFISSAAKAGAMRD